MSKIKRNFIIHTFAKTTVTILEIDSTVRSSKPIIITYNYGICSKKTYYGKFIAI